MLPNWNIGCIAGDELALAKPAVSSSKLSTAALLAMPAVMSASVPPQDFASWCAQNPYHPVAQQAASQGLLFATRIPFSQMQGNFTRQPTVARREPFGLGTVTAVAAGATANFTGTIQKPFEGDKLSVFGDVGSFVVLDIKAAGRTVTAGGGNIPAGAFQKLDELPNINFGALTAGAQLVVTVQNISGNPATLSAVVEGLAGE